jgi:hypothetical protein
MEHVLFIRFEADPELAANIRDEVEGDFNSSSADRVTVELFSPAHRPRTVETDILEDR